MNLKLKQNLGVLSLLSVLLFSAKTNEIANSYVISAVVSFILLYFSFLSDKNSIIGFVKIFSIFLCFFIYSTIIYLDVFPGFFLRFFNNFALSFCAIYLLRERFVESFVKVITVFSILSLPFFILQCVNFQTAFGLISGIQKIIGLPILRSTFEGQYYSNIIIYTINTSMSSNFFFARNCGFMFEPGPFGVIVIVAMLLDALQNGFQLKRTRFLILSFTLVTTLSSTGFICILIFAVFYVLNSNKNKIVYFTSFLLLAAWLISTPIIQKAFILYNSKDISLQHTLWMARYGKSDLSLGRFAGLSINIIDIKKNPFLGIGANNSSTENLKYKYKLQSINGIGNFTVRFGLVGFAILVFFLFKSTSAMVEDAYGNERPLQMKYCLFLMILVFLFAFNIHETSFLYLFVIYKYV